MIELKNISKIYKIPHEKTNTLKASFISLVTGKLSYEKLFALNNINLKINNGEFVGVIGKNGSGKSTLLKIIAEVILPTDGKLTVKGSVVPLLELGIGFQPELTVKDNVYLYGAILGFDKKNIDEKFDRIIQFAELENFVDTKLKNLSSGMQSRLGFSIAVEADSDILLVDEVLAVGDVSFVNKCYDVFKDFKRQGKTIVFVSHDMNPVMKFCDKTVLLDKGDIIKIGKTKNVVNHYLKLVSNK